MPGPVSCGAGVCGSAGCVWAGWASPVTVNGASRAAARRSARSRRASERGADMTGKLGRAVPAASQDSGTANSVRFALSDVLVQQDGQGRSEEHTSELQSLMRISYAVFCLKKKKIQYIKK